jgi:adenylate cyclase
MVSRIRDSVRNRLLLANVAGAVVVMAVLELALPESLTTGLGIRLAVVAFVAIFLVFAGLATVWAHLAFARSVAWVVEGRRPTGAERAEVLRLPWHSALRPLVFWVVAAASYPLATMVVGGPGPVTVIKISHGILLGGVVTCGLGFLMIERSFTSLFTITLAGSLPRRPATLGVRMRLLLAWMVGSAVPMVALAVIIVTPEEVPPEAAVVVLAAGGVGAGLIATWSAATSLAEPLAHVRDALARVRDGQLDTDLLVDDGGEIGEVQAGFNQMVKGLRDRERVRDLFGRHVGRAVAGHALEHGTGLGGEQKDASIIFVDIVGSTTLAEMLPPDEVVDLLNAFFDVVVRTIHDEGGWVNKFEGDGALCVFGVPGQTDNHRERALRAARRLQREMEALAERHRGLAAGIGVSSGTVVAGNVGAEERFEFTVIGRAVNEAARLTELAKHREPMILASEATVERGNGEADHWQAAGQVELRGHIEPTGVATLLRHEGDREATPARRS